MKNLFNRFIIYRSVMYFFISVFFLFILTQYIPSAINFLYLKMQDKNILVSVFPQGWAFFTRDPKEEKIELVYFSQNKLIPYDFIGIRSCEYFGFKRDVRQDLDDLSKKAQGVPEKHWKQLEFNKIYLDQSKPIILELNKRNFYKKLCNGEFIFVKKSPKLWAWRNLEDKRKVKYIKVKFLCK